MASSRQQLLILLVTISLASIIAAILFSDSLPDYNSWMTVETNYTASYSQSDETHESSPTQLFTFNKSEYKECPEGFEQCTNNLNDILQYMNTNHSVSEDCVANASKTNVKLFTHIQGADWLNYSDVENAYLNVTHSKAFLLHRLYYTDFAIPRNPKYTVLMNSIDACNLGDWGEIADIKGIGHLTHHMLHKYQCNLNLQNRSVSNLTVVYKEYSKWYPDHENFIDIVTANNAHSDTTDLYNQCYNEVYTPLECCGQQDPIRFDRAGNVFSRVQKEAGKRSVAILVNPAQSRGYYHV